MPDAAPKSTEVDLAVVGAGVAGLAAARTARERGLRVELLEAKHRTGGRALTDVDSLGVPWDRGCHWLHRARKNPITEIADRLGFAYRTEPVPGYVWLGDRWADADEIAERERSFAAGQEAGHAAAQAAQDVAMSAVLPDAGRWAPLHRQLLRGLTGADPDALSVLDDDRYEETGDNWSVRDGYGALVAAWAADTPVRLACPVRRIERGGDRVVLETAQGRLTARRAIVTASTSVLAGGAIRFQPALPEQLLDDLHDVPLGAANKVALAFDRDVFGVAHVHAAHLPRAPRGCNFQIRPFGRELAVGNMGGPFAEEIEAAGPDAARQLALDILAEMYGSAVRRHVTAAASTAWSGDPWIRGGYSVCRPGRAAARPRLAQPVDETLLLAGEACSLAAYGTANGAYESGVAAALAVADALAAPAG